MHNMIVFCLYFLTFMLLEAGVNQQAAAFLGANAVNLVYALGLLCTAAGYLLYGFAARRAKGRAPAMGAVLCCAVALLLCPTDSCPPFFPLGSLLCLLALGAVGGFLHALLAASTAQRPLGWMLGVFMALAIVLQFLLQSLPFIGRAAAALLLLSLLALYPKCRELSFPPTCKNEAPGKGLLFSGMIVVLMSGILALQDSIVVLKNANGEIALFSYVRLFYAVGLLAAGGLSHLWEGRYFNLSAVCAAFVSTIAISAFQGGNTAYNLSMAVMYFYSGFYVMFLTYSFVAAAPQHPNPHLAAGLGRTLRSLSTAAVVAAMLPFAGRENLGLLTAISCLLAIAILLLAYRGGLLFPAQEPAFRLDPEAVFDREHFDAFFARYSLTEREQEVFRLLVTTEEETQVIADTLCISRRVLQRHIASIYEKTGAHTRIGLLQDFMKH